MRKTLKVLILLIIIGVLLYIGYDIYRESTVKSKTSEINNIVNIERVVAQNETVEIEENINKDTNEVKVVENEEDNEAVPKTYKGYEVIANLKIEKLGIDTCVLSEYSKNAMEVCVVKFFGPDPNEIGNFCIAGHNYITKNMFSKIGKLEKGDKLVLTDNKNRKVEYEVYDKFKADANDTQKGLTQRTKGTRQITLISCCNYSKKRMIIKAVAKND